MKAYRTFIYSVVLWALVESRHVGRYARSLEAEEKGSNLTQKLHQEVIHSDVLQHFTTPISTSTVETTTHDSTTFVKEIPLLPEDINVQNLKNDDRVSFDRKTTISKQKLNDDLSDRKNVTVNNDRNDVISYSFNQTSPEGSTQSEVSVSQSSFDHSTSKWHNEDSSNNNEEPTFVLVSSTEPLKEDVETKVFEGKKKDKGKKEILDSGTVPTDHRIDKPYKDNIIKLKDKNKDLNQEALDSKRSTTRISDSDSVSLSEQDNKSNSDNSISSADITKTGSSSSNNEESVNQSVNSVISTNGVNNDSGKKRVKNSVKKPVDITNDAESDNSSANGIVFDDEANKNLVPGLNLESQTNTSRTSEEKALDHKSATDSVPTKVNIPLKTSTSSPTTIVKPSIAFKQQLTNKLKGLEPLPTVPINISEDNLEKLNNKLTNKSSLRKKPKADHYSELQLPPTATAWTLVSMKAASDASKTPPKSSPLPETSSPSTDESSVPTRQTTINPVSRVKSFIPWSTRLQKNISSTTTLPTTPSMDDTQLSENTPFNSNSKSSSDDEQMEKVPEHTSISGSNESSLSTDEQSIIRSTVELDRNMTDTSTSSTQSSLNDIMVKDQSSTISQEVSKDPEVLKTTNSEVKGESMNGTTTSNTIKEVAEKENIIETKQTLQDNETISKMKDLPVVKTEDVTIPSIIPINPSSIPSTPSNINNTVNEVVSGDFNESKENKLNHSLSLLTTVTPMIDTLDSVKMKNSSEAVELDPGTSDLLDNPGSGDDGKSGEESDEDFRPKQTTTVPPLLEPFETTMMPDLDEDVDGDSDREEDDLSPIIDKLNTNQTVQGNTISTNTTKETNEIKPTTPVTPSHVDSNKNATYVTSFDIVSRENTTQVVTRTPQEGDINWYSIDSKPINSSAEDPPRDVPIDTTTTAAIETTIEPEAVTHSAEQPDVTESVASPSSLSTAMPTVEPTTEDDPELDVGEDPTSCVRLVVHSTPLNLCRNQQQFRGSVAAQLKTSVTGNQVVLVDRRQLDCMETVDSTTKQNIAVDVCFIDTNGVLSPALRDEFLELCSPANDSIFPIVNVLKIMQSPMMDSDEGFDNVQLAIILSVISAICLVLLGILLLVIRKRQSRFNYGQRCTPVSLDDYSLDNISVYNSVRRKGGARASKRSYGNPGFDDPGAPTHEINFAGLANFSSDRAALDEEYAQIPSITVKSDELPAGAESKNRYANVIPLPETRVVLENKDSADPLGDYINANFVKGPKGQEKLYIACQAPLQSTVEDFWRMVWQQQSKVILMLTALNENGVEKCADYLPQLEITDCHRRFGDFQVTLKKHEVREKYIISTLQLKNLDTNLWREVTHLWYSSWPAQGVPEDGSAMIAFLIEARSYTRGAQGPTVVHCSPGTGRTGTVIAIDLCIRDFETKRTVDIPKTVYALRRDRAGSVQTKDQYSFIYQVLNLYATKLTGGANLDSI